MTDREVMQQALEALIDAANVLSAPMFADAAAALRTALEQPEERPWQGLTPEEMKHLYPYERSVWGKETYEAIEKALKERNHG